MPRPVFLGIAGDSAAGKTTLTRGLVRLLGGEHVVRLAVDDYHRYDRAQRAQREITPLHPDCNRLDILEQHLAHLRASEPVLAPQYRHRDGTFGPPRYLQPARFMVVEGLLALHTAVLREIYDVRVFVTVPEPLRREWKIGRDCARRGYTTDEVLVELDRREHDAEACIRPQRSHADIVVSFMPGDRGDQAHLDAHVVLRGGLRHPDLPSEALEGSDPVSVSERGRELHLRIPGTIDPERAGAIEEAIWDRMRFASHLRTDRLGEFTTGTVLGRSEPLAIVQVLILYQLVTARAAVALGAEGARTEHQVAAPA